jgi:hypothetical protein
VPTTDPFAPEYSLEPPPERPDANPNRPHNPNRPNLLRPRETEQPARWKTSTQCLYNEPRSALWHKHRATLDNLHDVRDEFVIGAGGPSHIKVAFLNVRGLTIDKLDYILWYYEHAKLDVLLLIDVQLTREEAYFKKAAIHERVGNDTLVISKITADRRLVGGQLAILRPTVAKLVTKVTTDPTGLGTSLTITLKQLSKSIAITGVYWPSKQAGPTGLWSMVKQYQQAHNIRGSVTRFMQQQLEATINRHMQDPHNTHVVGGDFNANWLDTPTSPKRSHPAIRQISDQLGLTNPLQAPDAPKHHTRTIGSRSSCIDHVLYTPTSATATAAGTNYAAMWGKHTDHRPVWVSLQLEVPLAQPPRTNPTKVRKIRRVDLDRKDPSATAAFHDALRNCISSHTPDPANPTALGLLLEDICVTSTNATRLTLKPLMRRNKFHRDGWSPSYNVMAQQTRALTEIKRRLLGQHGRHRWRTEAAIHDGIRDIIQSWTTSAAAYRWRTAAELNDLLNCTGNSPESWFNRVPTPLEIDIECAAVARKMQGRTRREIRTLVSEANAKKEQDRVNHKFKRLIRAITAKAINPYTMETLQHLDGTMTSEPSEIHHVLTVWFHKWFQYDRDITGTLHEDNNWQDFLHDRTQFDLLLLNTSIEPDISDILWQALHETALRLTESDREELESLMTTPRLRNIQSQTDVGQRRRHWWRHRMHLLNDGRMARRSYPHSVRHSHTA